MKVHKNNRKYFFQKLCKGLKNQEITETGPGRCIMSMNESQIKRYEVMLTEYISKLNGRLIH